MSTEPTIQLPSGDSQIRLHGLLSPTTFDHLDATPNPRMAAQLCGKYNFAGLWAAEQRYDPMMALARVGQDTPVRLGTAVTVALARNPMVVAQAAFDLHSHCSAGFTLGLGPQLPVNLKYRYAMPADHRIARMREFVGAVREIWDAWQNDRPYYFKGDYYTHTAFSPFFTPPPNLRGTPPVLMAAHGPLMAELAGEIADGLVIPPYAGVDHIADVLLPAVNRGLARSSRSRAKFNIVCSPLIATGRSSEEYSENLYQTRQLLALWLGTKRYGPEFQRAGLQGVTDVLSSRQLSWNEKVSSVDDDVVDQFAIATPEPTKVGIALARKYHGLVDSLLVPVGPPDSLWDPTLLRLADADPLLTAD